MRCGMASSHDLFISDLTLYIRSNVLLAAVAWPIHPHVWHDAFKDAARSYDMPHSIPVKWLNFICVGLERHICDMSHSYVSHHSCTRNSLFSTAGGASEEPPPAAGDGSAGRLKMKGSLPKTSSSESSISTWFFVFQNTYAYGNINVYKHIYIYI